MQQATTQTKELTIFNRVLTVTEYASTQTTLAELNGKFKDVIFPVHTKEGMKDAKETRSKLKKLRTTLENKRKELKEPALRRSQAIDGEARDLKAAIEALETSVDEQITAQEQKEAREEAERQRVEKIRVDGINGKIAAIRSIVAESANDSIEDLDASIADMEGWVISDEDGFAEFIQDARTARDETLAALRQLRADAVARAELAAEQTRLAEERAAFEREKAEFEAKQRGAEVPKKDDTLANIEAEFKSGNHGDAPAAVDEIDDLFDRSEHPPRAAAAPVDEEPVDRSIAVFAPRVVSPSASPRKPAFVPSFARTDAPSAAADQFVDVFDDSLKPGPIVMVSQAPLYPNQAPAGYWMDGEYWGATPEGEANAAATFAETGTPIKLVPFWTHNQEVEFNVSMVNGKLRVVPASDEAAALLRSPFEAEGE
ncbi:DUF1351 domain-containing protein [Paraburkholderia terrae]|uniref:DUF1351 domain-containing protein n=1 Tax=Paraburkholderia terrae TaxID=311230 RepID=UPI001EE262C6|nr:DUF1351 domain-containing protein [Paraburkholderia terrae]GJH00263.1 hypothetical protein CBA19C8_06920 [Paraburkholderia terrae]